MGYREKSAWLTLVAMLIAYGIYFPLILSRPMPAAPIELLWTFGAIAGIQGICVAIGAAYLALRAGSRAARAADERDRSIARRGATLGYYVLLTGMILVGVVMPFGDPPAKIVNTALLAIVIAETVRLATIVASYRRGWHG